MKHAVIVSHPKAGSFNLAVARAYAAAAKAAGDEVVFRDLYRMKFDPCLRAEEIPDPEGFAPGPDIVAERDLLKDVDVFVLVYPLWFNAPPAMLVGYLDRVFGFGFGFGSGGGGNVPLLTGARLISFTSSGAPRSWLVETGAWEALRAIFDTHFAAVCGLQVLDHIHFGGLVTWTREDVVAGLLDDVREKFAAWFARPAGADRPAAERESGGPRLALAPTW
jgi:NAD(P)H dehydrogenase (quinone)